MSVTRLSVYGGIGIPYGDFTGKTEQVVAPETSKPIVSGRIIPAYTRKIRKWTKKDEKELKTLILKAVEEDANWKLVQKARELAEVSNAAKGIRQAVASAELAVIEMKKRGEISAREALERIEEIEEEEDLILLLAEVI